MSLRFEHPEFLFLLVLFIPLLFVIAGKSLAGLKGVKRWFSLSVRTLLFAIIIATLAQPTKIKTSRETAVIVVIDESYSIPPSSLRNSLGEVRSALDRKDPGDRFAVITVGKNATISVMPGKNAVFKPGQPQPEDRDGTNLAAGLRLALAIAPYDAASRILLVSDGRETADNVRAEAELCRANGIPVDVLPVTYNRAAEVVFESVEAPVQARPGQALNLKLVLRSTSETTGFIGVSRNGTQLDLNGQAPGRMFEVTLHAGVNTFRIPVDVPENGMYRWQASFENSRGVHVESDSEMPGGGLLQASTDTQTVTTGDNKYILADNPNNNTAEAVTFVRGEGTVLILDRTGEESAELADALRKSRINIVVKTPQDAASDLVGLMEYDAVILANIPVYDLNYDEQLALKSYVHDTGGGLIMVGGPLSFGAGGWIGSPVADALPVEMDPPQTRQLPRGAVVMIMHSTEMSQANYWTEQSALAAVNGLTRDDLVGVIDFNWTRSGDVWEYPLSLVGDRSEVKNVIKNLPLGDMPSFGSSISLALKSLIPAKAGQKAIIIFSDGDASPPSPSVMRDCVKNKITITTIMFAGHGQKTVMANIAKATGGEFFHVRNPKKLPQLFSKVAQDVQRSLIVEGEVYTLDNHDLTGPTVGMGKTLPPLAGYILTSKRGGQSNIAVTTNLGDPAFASWQFGLGRSIACTFDVNPSRWANQWVKWDKFEEFWEQAVRWVMKPSTPSNVSIFTDINGDVVTVEARILTEEGEFSTGEQLQGSVLLPSLKSLPLKLSQIGPGRYAGQFRLEDPGAYSITIRSGAGDAETAIKQGIIQAVVSVPFSREYRSVSSDTALLHDIADITDGRYFSSFDPRSIDLFDSKGLVFPEQTTDIWPLFAIIAVGFLLFDVALRRVAIDPRALVAKFRQSMHKQARISTESMEAFRRAQQHVRAKKTETGSDRGKTETINPAARFTSHDQTDTSILDTTPKSSTQVEDHQPKPRRVIAISEDDVQQEGDSLSRLLNVKRRARGDHPGDDSSSNRKEDEND